MDEDSKKTVASTDYESVAASNQDHPTPDMGKAELKHPDPSPTIAEDPGKAAQFGDDWAGESAPPPSSAVLQESKVKAESVAEDIAESSKNLAKSSGQILSDDDWNALTSEGKTAAAANEPKRSTDDLPPEISNDNEDPDTSREGRAAGCAGTTRDGKPCDAAPMHGGNYCLFHNPKTRDLLAEAQKRGGRANGRKVLERAEELPLGNGADVCAFLAKAANGVLNGEIDPKAGTSVGYICSVLMKAHETSSLERRFNALEKALRVNRDGRGYESHDLGDLFDPYKRS